jgi:hypothetical protein
MYELHKVCSPYSSTVDRELLKEYFSPVSELSSKLEKQVRYTI